ncbi:MAG TPA: carbohydrate ABC transporter permease [Ktedonobacteraceae bacterium]|nr:carbohydrate ABC transporter permease [Ktedonobacteraceae bacterium]
MVPPWMERSDFVTRWAIRIIMIVLAALMLFPFAYVLAVSFSNLQDVVSGKLVIFPSHPTFAAYIWVLQSSGVVQGFGVSLLRVLLGTGIDMVMTTLMAYALCRRGVPGTKFFLWMVLLTMLLSPSLITSYLVVRQLHLIDTIWALILPTAIAPFNLIVLRQFFMNIPLELIESAKLDGASDLRILWSIVVPLSKASLAAIALFYAVGHWNSFFDAIMYINDPQLFPLSVILRQVVIQGSLPQDIAMATEAQPPDITIQMAVVVITTVPILLLYPFLQKYFTRGVLTGSIKG